MPNGINREPVLGIPLGGEAVQTGKRGGLGAPQLETQEIGEQVVVAEPGPVSVDGVDESAGVFELEQDPLGALCPEEAVCNRPVYALEDRRPQQELTYRLGLALEDLGEQVIGHRSLAAGEFGDESLRVRPSRERQRREPKAGDPALGASLQRLDGVGGERDPGGGKQLACLVELKAKVRGAQLGELARETESMEPERRIVASREDHSQLWRPAVEQHFERRQRPGLEQVMQIVDDEQEGFVERSGAVDDSLHDANTVEAGGWSEIVDRAPHAGGSPQRLHDSEPEPLLIALVALDGDPCRPLAHARSLDPGSKEDALAAAGRCGYERDAAVIPGRKPPEERWPRYERGPANECRALGGSHGDIVSRHRRHRNHRVRKSRRFRDAQRAAGPLTFVRQTGRNWRGSPGGALLCFHLHTLNLVLRAYAHVERVDDSQLSPSDCPVCEVDRHARLALGEFRVYAGGIGLHPSVSIGSLRLEFGDSRLRVRSRLLPRGPGSVRGSPGLLLRFVEGAVGLRFGHHKTPLQLLARLDGRGVYRGFHVRHASLEPVNLILVIHLDTPFLSMGCRSLPCSCGSRLVDRRLASTSGGGSTHDVLVDLAGQFVDLPCQLGVELQLLVFLGEFVIGLGLRERALAVLADHHEGR